MASFLSDSGSTVVDTHSAAMSSAVDNNSKLAKNTVLTAVPPSSSLDSSMQQCDNDNPSSGPLTQSQQSLPMEEHTAIGASSKIGLPDNAMSSSRPPKPPPPPPRRTAGKSPRQEYSLLRRNSSSASSSVMSSSQSPHDPHPPLPQQKQKPPPPTSKKPPTLKVGEGGVTTQTLEEKKEGELEPGMTAATSLAAAETAAARVAAAAALGAVRSSSSGPSSRVNGSSKKKPQTSNRSTKGTPKGSAAKGTTKVGSVKKTQKGFFKGTPKVKDTTKSKGGSAKKSSDLIAPQKGYLKAPPKGAVKDTQTESAAKAPPKKALPPTGGQKASKTLRILKTVRTSYEKAMIKDTTESPTSDSPTAEEPTNAMNEAEKAAAPSPDPSPPPEERIQFLATQPAEDDATNKKEKVNFDKRVTFDGNILDRIAAVPMNDVTSSVEGLGATIAGRISSSSAAGIASGSALYGTMNNVSTMIPTMAPPMFPDRPPPLSADIAIPELDKSLENWKKKKKKGKKKGHERIDGNAESGSLADGGEPLEEKKKKKGKKRDREKNDGNAEAVAGGEPSEKKKARKREREKSNIDSMVGSESQGESFGPKKKRARGKKSEGKSGKKGKKSLGKAGRKSEGKQTSLEGDQSAATSNSTTDVNGMNVSIGVKPPPPPSPGKLLPSPRKSDIYNYRTIPSPTRHSKQHTISSDEFPHRISNPLLRLPQFPNAANYGSNSVGFAGGSGGGIIPIEDIPQAGELWNLANIHFSDPDTWPISYLARILGFELPESGVGREFGQEFDPLTVGRCNKDESLSLEKTGVFGERIWKNASDSDGSSVANNITAANTIQNGITDDLNLSFCDPLWASILQSYRGYKFNEEDFKDCTGKMGFENTLNEVCLGYARERGVLLAKEKEKIVKEEKVKEEEQVKDASNEVEGKEETGEGSVGVVKEEEGVGVNFRFATVDDEESLRSLADKCQWKFHPKHDLGTSLRSQSNFCIVAEKPSTSSSRTSASAGASASGAGGDGSPSPAVVAFLQYRFCWYRVEEKKRAGNVSTDTISELVIFIDNLVYEDVGGGKGSEGDETGKGKTGEGETTIVSPKVSPKELETAKVLLASLALVHAARSGVWYGMMESPKVQVPFFTKYFRMSNVSRGEESTSLAKEDGSSCVGTVPLVLDIKKCHFKYAILLLEESLKKKSILESSTSCQKKRKYNNVVDDIGSTERMIVHLTKTANGSEEIMSSRSSRAAVGGVFSNSNNTKDESKKKRAHVRLVQTSDAELSNAELFSVSASPASASVGGGGEEKEEVLNPIDPSNIDASVDWNVMRLFPLRSDRTSQNNELGKRDEATDCPSNDISNDIFLSELQQKQTQLALLESSITTTSRRILSKAYDEHTAFATGDRHLRSQRNEQKLQEYKEVQTRLHEAELAWQAQLDQDMDAVCDVCFDGEVIPDNQIIFCDACNVAVHQRCYGIDQIPSGNYFCHTCTHFEIDKEFLAAKRRRDGPPVKITRHPIVCELCPRRQGAFVQVQTLQPAKKAKWVHVGCAKWQGMNYVDIELKDKIEDLTTLKDHFKIQSSACTLCKSSIGALHQCRVEGCDKWLHLTCARSLGKCSVQHGENCEGFYDLESIDHPPWTLACPKHSEIADDPESIKEGSLTTEQLVAIAESYPPEPIPAKPFYKMNATERKEYWSDAENLEEFFEKVLPSLDGAKCALCEMPADPSIDKRCDKCGVLSHADCADPARGDRATCLTCRFTEKNANRLRNYEEPKCHMCSHPNASGGPLLRSFAKPVSMKVWKGSALRFQKSIFGKDKFCHALCGMWNPLCETENNGEAQDTFIDCTNTAMSNGKDHVSHQFRCTLCGLYTGAKVDCSIEGCVAPGGTRMRAKFHVTCARQAGLEVLADVDCMSVKCFNHVECDYVFRARLEDLREIELNRFSSKKFKASVPMTWGHASSLLHATVNILRTLGWSWRWAEWWVDHGDNWEPLIEAGQREEDMTEEELKVVHSTRQSRCEDARQCRLAAFGAALRNRDYDKEEGDDQEPLERALTAIISTRSLVGPLKKREVEFFVTWLALAYRSKSPVLGFGNDKTPVATDCFCVHQEDASPKYELGGRPLPGKTKPQNGKGVFEPRVEEVDDFLKTPVPASPERKIKKKKENKKKRKKKKREEEEEEEDDMPDEYTTGEYSAGFEK